MRFTDVMMAVPALLLAMAMAGLIQQARTIQLVNLKSEGDFIVPAGDRVPVAARPAQHPVRHRRRQLDGHRPRGARPGAGPQGAGLRRGGPRHRLLPHAHPVAAHPAQRAAGHHRAVGHEYGRRHRPGGGPGLPRRRRAAAGAVVGHHDLATACPISPSPRGWCWRPASPSCWPSSASTCSARDCRTYSTPTTRGGRNVPRRFALHVRIVVAVGLRLSGRLRGRRHAAAAEDRLGRRDAAHGPSAPTSGASTPPSPTTPAAFPSSA